MKAVVYTSRVAESVADESQLIQDITAVAHANNPICGISGAMVLQNHRFLQVIEGPEIAVDTLFDSISRDSRHCEVTVLFEETISLRQFDEWSMAIFEIENETTFELETITSLKKLYDASFTYDGQVFLQLLRSTLNDPIFMQDLKAAG